MIEPSELWRAITSDISLDMKNNEILQEFSCYYVKAENWWKHIFKYQRCIWMHCDPNDWKWLENKKVSNNNMHGLGGGRLIIIVTMILIIHWLHFVWFTIKYSPWQM